MKGIQVNSQTHRYYLVSEAQTSIHWLFPLHKTNQPTKQTQPTKKMCPTKKMEVTKNISETELKYIYRTGQNRLNRFKGK